MHFMRNLCILFTMNILRLNVHMKLSAKLGKEPKDRALEASEQEPCLGLQFSKSHSQMCTQTILKYYFFKKL